VRHGGAVIAAALMLALVTPLVYRISPAVADPAVTHFVDDNIVEYRPDAAPGAPLLVFMPGTGGRPAGASDFLDVAASAGYRVIGLMYDDVPAVNVICPQQPDPLCTELVRRKRVYGNDDTDLIGDTGAESIVSRLTKLLQYLNAQHPGDGWNAYLQNGAPNWPRIAVGGHSQGAGMAAFIAKEHAVYRVVLFSSPWDFYRPGPHLAAWLLQPSATPAERWYAAYHAGEPEARLLARAYAGLDIPPSHVRVLQLEPNRNARNASFGAMLYHASVVGNSATPRTPDGAPAYEPAWRFLLGTPAT
jgi:predicted esterase